MALTGETRNTLTKTSLVVTSHADCPGIEIRIPQQKLDLELPEELRRL